jgi:DNA repair exonuclease SbcCD nuclease subunit
VPRLLHTADWQIGRAFNSFQPESAVPLAQARLDAVKRLAELATEHQVDAVLVAGDVFDAQTLGERTVRQLFAALAGFSGPWVLLPGNHDAALEESIWSHAQRLGVVPANVHLALRAQPLLLDAARLAVLPAPLTQRHTATDLTQWFAHAVTPEGYARIGLAHGSVQGVLAEAVDSPNPIAPDCAQRAQLAYLALGDWHGTKCINERTWYSGTPEPDRFRNNDAGQALLVELGADGTPPRVQALPVGQYRWRQHAVQLRVASDLEALLAWLGQLQACDVVDLRVSGHTDLAGQQALQTALGQAGAVVRHLQTELSELTLMPTDEDVAALQADGYLGELLGELRAELRELSSGPEAQRTRDALALLCATLAQRRPLPGASV